MGLAFLFFAFVTGIGAVTIGAGGVFLIIALYLGTPLSASTIAGTLSATSVGTALLISYYGLSTGDILTTEDWPIVVMLSSTGVLGAVAGAELNITISDATFGLLLGGFTVVVGSLVLYRELRDLGPVIDLTLTSRTGLSTVGVFGFAVGMVGSLFGIGGPVLAVPVLVLVGTPLVLAVIVAQIQSIFLSASATASYFTHGAVSWPLVILLGVPQVIGVAVGWKIARSVDPTRLKLVLGASLIILGPLLAL